MDTKEYTIEIELDTNSPSKYVTYDVKNIIGNIKPVDQSENLLFMKKVTSETRAKSILEKYPDFVQMVIDDKEDNIEVDRLENVGKKTIRALANKVRENFVYYDVIVEFDDYGLTHSQVHKLYQTYKLKEEIIKRMETNPYKTLCKVAGIGFKIADKKILNKDASFLKTPYRMMECIDYVLFQNQIEGNTWISKEDLYRKCRELTPQCMEYFQYIVEKSTRFHYDSIENRVALIETYQCEKDICELLLNLQNNNSSWTSEDIPEELYQVENIVLTERQRSILPTVLNNSVIVLAGYAGAGKSASCKAVIQMIEHYKKAYCLLAPTGRAASVLSGYTERVAMTIHRGLGAKGNDYFSYNSNNKIPASFIIVDESSMIDIFLMRNLLRAIELGTKILFVCDPAQIPSVGAGNVLQDIIHSKKFPTVILDQVFRYKEGGLSYAATNARKGEQFLKGIDTECLGVNKDYKYISSKDEDVVKKAVDKYVELYNSGISEEDLVIISCYNKGSYGTLEINNKIQSIINPVKRKYDSTVGYKKNNVDIKFNENDRVLMTKNIYNERSYIKRGSDFIESEDGCTIYNGDFGKVLKINEDGQMYVKFDTSIIMFEGGNISDLVLGYSVSCHKMQGDSREHVIFITPKAHTFFLNRNLLYVALTRAKTDLYHFGDYPTIKKSLKCSANLSRKTFLENMLVS